MFGYSHPWQMEEVFDVQIEDVRTILPETSWFNWKYDHASDPLYVPMMWHLWISDYFDKGVAVGEEFPGRLWFCGNEPDRSQQATMPVTSFIQGLQTFRSRVDCTVAAPGTLIVNYSGLNWVKSFLEQYTPDKLLFHVYGYNDPKEWMDFWNGFKDNWYLQNGKGLPVILNEVGGNNPELIFFLQELIQKDDILERVYWFTTVNDFPDREEDKIRSSWLMNTDFTLTEHGKAFNKIYEVGATGDLDYTIFLPRVKS